MPTTDPRNGLLFTDRQLDVMNILWGKGSATVKEVRAALEEPPAYTTILTLFQTLEKNGLVGHVQEGNAYRYYPEVSRTEAQQQGLRYVRRRLFQGSDEAILAALAQSSENGASGTLRESMERLEATEG